MRKPSTDEPAGREAPAAEKKTGAGRLVFMDWLRVYGFLVVFTYHALVRHGELFAASGHPWLVKLWEHACGWNVGISVGLFFLASGMGLMLSSRGESFSVRTFYRRRFAALLIPFYLAWVFGLLVGLPASAARIAAVGRPVLSILLSATALDGFAAVRYGISNWYMVGEWFLGTLVLLYLVFPLLRALCRRQPQVFLAAAVVFCLAADWLMIRAGQDQAMVSPLSRGLPFCAGMYLAEEFRRGRGTVNAAAGFGLLLVWIVLDVSLDVPAAGILQSDIRSLAVFTGAMLAEPVLSRAGKLSRAVGKVSALTYALYLVHHVLLDACGALLPANGSLKRAALAILAAAALSLAAALLLKKAGGALAKKVSGR